MSGNINDTNVKLIQKECFNMISDLEKYGHNIAIYERLLQKKYNNLFTTSKTLFNLILNSFKNKNFDKQHFNMMINKMLENITKIQTNQISQHDASVEIGTDLAYKYIPQLKEKIESNTLDNIQEIEEIEDKFEGEDN